MTINTAELVAGEYTTMIRVSTGAAGIVNPINDIQVNLLVSCTHYLSYVAKP